MNLALQHTSNRIYFLYYPKRKSFEQNTSSSGRKKWSQQELADKVGVSRQTISSVEANRYSPSLVLAFEIAYSFGKDIQDVFQYKL